MPVTAASSVRISVSGDPSLSGLISHNPAGTQNLSEKATARDALFSVERRFGRRREFYQAPRTLDLDLLLYDELVVDSLPLSVPHPRMHLRAFVLAPLLEIAPHCRIPGRGSAVAWLPAVSMQRIEKLAA